MDGRQKFIIAGLLIIAVLFVGGIGAGIRFNKSGEANPTDKPKPWTKVLGAMLEPFGPKLDVTGLRCNNQPVAAGFALTQAAPECTIAVPPAEDDYRKATLHLLDQGVKVYLPCEDKNRPCKNNVNPNAPPGFKVIYVESGESIPQYWISQESNESVRLVALEEGGTLTLECDVCTAQNRSVRLRFE
ncbi:MAG: hypothetical protein ACREU9_10860 [Gammaproteobacteria bacterium]